MSPNPAITLFAVLFGVIWTAANLYGFYPLVQTAIDRAITTLFSGRSGTAVADGGYGPETDGGYGVGDPPSMDVFLAAYQEADVIEQAISSVCDAGYAGELNLTVLLEPGDDPTHNAVDTLRHRFDFDVLTIPEGYPGDPNKPRALNYGFEHTDGDIVGIVDAEDLVDADMFLEAALAVSDGADYAQARLDMVNEDDGWLNLMFRAEYGFWYNVITPAFVHVNYPLPLGGTSCFFRRDVLEAMSERRLERRGDPWTDAAWEWITDHDLAGVRPWDPQNVTEDFEIGLLLWEQEYDFAYLDSVTVEESPLSFSGWLKQRTRWKKGKLYTFLDRVEHPPERRTDRAHVYWQSVLPHLGPANIAGIVVLTLIGNLARYRPGDAIGVVLALGIAFGLLYCLFFGAGYYLTSDRPRPMRLRRSVTVTLTLPLYWLVQWGADVRAVGHTYTGRLHWEQINHAGRAVESNSRNDPASVGRPGPELTLPDYRRWAALAAVVLVGGVLRAFNLGGTSLWTDELYSVVVRGTAPLDALLLFGEDPHPPLYYLLVRAWTELFGTGPVAVRSLSVAFGLGTVVAVYLLATELFDDRTGLLAAALVAASTFFVHYSRIARMYSLLTFLTALSWYWFVRLRERGRVTVAGYALTTAALVFTHVYGLFVVAAQHVYVALSEHNGGIARRRWVRIQALLGALTLPWLVVFARQVLELLVGTGGANLAWIPEPTSVMLTNTALSYIGYPDFHPFPVDSTALYVLAAAVLFAYIAQLLASLFRLDDGLPTLVDGDAISQLGTLVIVVTVVPFLISFVVPIYVPRYTAAASVGVVILAARGLRNVPVRKVRAGLLAVVLLSSLLFVGVYYTADSVEPWDQVATSIQSDAGPDDVVVHQPGNMGGYADYYYDDPAFETTTVSAAERLDVGDLETLGELSRSKDTVFLVQYYGSEGAAVDYLGACHQGQETRTQGVITVLVFERDGECPSPGEVLGNATA